METREVLEKFGRALYIHKEIQKQAQKGKEAVDYLVKMGVFGSGGKPQSQLGKAC